MIRTWRFWWNTLILACQQNPPQFVELVMLLLAIALLGTWLITPHWSYLVLAWSYVVGVSALMWVRSLLVPNHQTPLTQVSALVLLLLSIYGFADVIHYL